MSEKIRSKELMLHDLLEGAIGDWQDLNDLMDEVMAIVDSRNTVVREGAQQGIPIVSMMRKDLKEAWVKYREQLHKDGGIETIRNAALLGRVRGLAQAVATVESPYTRLHSPQRDWINNVKRVMEEARR